MKKATAIYFILIVMTFATQVKAQNILAKNQLQFSLNEPENSEVDAWYLNEYKIECNVTSTLKAQGVNNYEAINLSDGQKNTAWVEGKTDNGIGEKITFTIKNGFYDEPNESIELFNGKLHIINGVYKSDISYKNNSRVKKFKIYHNNNFVSEVTLNDYRGVQLIDLNELFDISDIEINMSYDDDSKIKTIGQLITEQQIKGIILNKKSTHKLKSKDMITLEITETYPGLKWQDTGISEIFCYPKTY